MRRRIWRVLYRLAERLDTAAYGLRKFTERMENVARMHEYELRMTPEDVVPLGVLWKNYGR